MHKNLFEVASFLLTVMKSDLIIGLLIMSYSHLNLRKFDQLQKPCLFRIALYRVEGIVIPAPGTVPSRCGTWPSSMQKTERSPSMPLKLLLQ